VRAGVSIARPRSPTRRGTHALEHVLPVIEHGLDLELAVLLVGRGLAVAVVVRAVGEELGRGLFRGARLFAARGRAALLAGLGRGNAPFGHECRARVGDGDLRFGRVEKGAGFGTCSLNAAARASATPDCIHAY
jgi:hypothetical protein